MLIDFRTLFPKYGINPKGVLHIGGNVGEEFPVYMELGINNQIWFEANPEIYEKLVENISGNGNAIAYNYCVGETDGEIVLHISNNAGQSSSILELGTHKTAHPEVHYIKDVPVKMIRLDDFFEKKSIEQDLIDPLNAFDFLNIDIQGAELMALRGMEDLLHHFKWAYLEVNRAHLYKDCALVDEIDDYLSTFEFERVETLWAGNTGWGDALYIKK